MNLPSSHHTGRHVHAGLARIDILVLTTTLVIAGAMLLPAGARTDERGNAIRCLSNHQRLAKAWLSFAMDNAGQLPGNADPVPGAPLNWATGWLDYTPNPDNTNRLRLVNGALGPYLDGDTSVFKCPADRSRVRIGGRFYSRVRSVSMNSYVGGSYNGAFYVPNYRTYQRLSQIVAPAPSSLWVLLDEREDSLNDCQFIVGMEGYDPRVPTQTRMIDYPAAYHNSAGALSFADGHAELHRWRDTRTMPVLRPGQLLTLNVASPNNRDITWLQTRTSARLPR